MFHTRPRLMTTWLLATATASTYMHAAHAQTLTVQGTWQAVDNPDPAYLSGINTLQGWNQRDFSLRLGWLVTPPTSSNLGNYPLNPDGYSTAWVWDNTVPDAPRALVELAVEGVGQLTYASPLTYLQVIDNWTYDGSHGVLNPGTYDVFHLWGMSDTCPSSGPEYWGQCVPSDAQQGRFSFDIRLFGAADVLTSSTEPPSFSLVAGTSWLGVAAEVDQYLQGNALAGSVEYATALGPDAIRTLQISSVPEPASVVMWAAGCLLLAGVQRQTAGRKADRYKALPF